MAGTSEAGLRFREVQRITQWWIWAVAVLLTALAWWAFLQQVVYGVPFGNRPASDAVLWVVWCLFGLLLPLLMAVERFVVDLDHERLRLVYVPFCRRTVPLASIERAEAVTYRPMAEYWGWGIRWTPKRGWAWTVRGNRGVMLDLAGGKRLLVGSQRPEELARALDAARG